MRLRFRQFEADVMTTRRRKKDMRHLDVCQVATLRIRQSSIFTLISIRLTKLLLSGHTYFELVLEPAVYTTLILRYLNLKIDNPCENFLISAAFSAYHPT